MNSIHVPSTLYPKPQEYGEMFRNRVAEKRLHKALDDANFKVSFLRLNRHSLECRLEKECFLLREEESLVRSAACAVIEDEFSRMEISRPECVHILVTISPNIQEGHLSALSMKETYECEYISEFLAKQRESCTSLVRCTVGSYLNNSMNQIVNGFPWKSFDCMRKSIPLFVERAMNNLQNGKTDPLLEGNFDEFLPALDVFLPPLDAEHLELELCKYLKRTRISRLEIYEAIYHFVSKLSNPMYQTCIVFNGVFHTLTDDLLLNDQFFS